MDDDLSTVRIAVIGLGYVGLPLARLFATQYSTVGYDCDEKKVSGLREFPAGSDMEAIRDSNFYVIAVPTPVDDAKRPVLEPLLAASRLVGSVLCRGDVVVYESTVYPGTTEKECVPQLEEVSGLVFNRDFFVGYSPERVNPGDGERTVGNICKITSGSTSEVADFIDAVYASVLNVNTCKVSTIRVAEAAKILENCQRDVNIAFINEAARILNAMGIDTREVLEAASTKWNFLNFSPGLVGGHCISVDPYYFIRSAKTFGVVPRVMSAAREVNEEMGPYVASQVLRCMNNKGILANGASVLILGFSFKENCPDIRNTKVADVIRTLCGYGCKVSVYDPIVDEEAAFRHYGIRLLKEIPDSGFEAVVLCVAHTQFEGMNVRRFLVTDGVVYDVKGILPKDIVDGRL